MRCGSARPFNTDAKPLSVVLVRHPTSSPIDLRMLSHAPGAQAPARHRRLPLPTLYPCLLRRAVPEVVICEGDLIGKTREQLRSPHYRREREWLKS